MISLDSVGFGDGRYTLALPLKWIVEIEQKCGAPDRDGVHRPKSIYTIHAELEAGLGITPDDMPAYLGGGLARPSDIREVLRCALIGGGVGMVGQEEIKVGPHKAAGLVDTYLPNPVSGWVEGQHLAWAILNATIRGPQLKKKSERASGRPKPFERGQLVASCGQLGLDWERVSLAEFWEALEAHNAAVEGGGDKPDLERLKRFSAARRSVN